MEKCMEFLVHTENAILSWSSTRAREDCVSRALWEGGFLKQDEGKIPATHFPAAWTGAFVFVKNCERSNQRWASGPHSFLFNTDQLDHSLSEPFFFFFLPYAECSPCDLEKYSLVVDERELGEQNSFSYHSQLLSLCSSFFSLLNVSWSYATFGICLTFHVLPN